MKRRFGFQTGSTILSSVFIAALLPSTAALAQQEIANDSFDSMQQGRVATAELITGEMYAATFQIPPSLLPAEMLGVRVVMVSDPSQPGRNDCGRFTVEVWEDDLSVPARTSPHCNGVPIDTRPPSGQVIYSMETQFQADPIGFQVQADPNNYQDLLFSSVNNNPQLMATIPPVMLTTTQVRVGLKALDLQCGAASADAYPLMLADQDGEQTAGSNYLYGYLQFVCDPINDFYLWEDMAQFLGSTPGDFVMRLLIRTQGGMVELDMGAPVADMDPVVDMTDPLDMTPDAMMQDMAVSDQGSTSAEEMGQTPDMATSGGEEMGSLTPDQGEPTGDVLEVSSISPSRVTKGEALEVAILGKGFEAGLEVSLNARKIGVVETKRERVLASIPADLEVGFYDVIVTNPGGESALKAMGLEVVAVAAGEGMGGGALAGEGSPDDGCGCQSSSTPAGRHGALLLVCGLLALSRLRRRRG